jgi:hypothetical protein
LGSSLTQYQSPISSLDKNGDGIISADELAAANVTSTASTPAAASTATADDGDSSSNVIQRITADILSLMLQVQQQSDSGDDSDSAGDGSNPKGILESLDTDGDGKLTTSEILASDTSALGDSASSDEDGSLMTNVLSGIQKALQAYQNTYGSSPAADTPDAAEEIQAI